MYIYLKKNMISRSSFVAFYGSSVRKANAKYDLAVNMFGMPQTGGAGAGEGGADTQETVEGIVNDQQLPVPSYPVTLTIRNATDKFVSLSVQTDVRIEELRRQIFEKLFKANGDDATIEHMVLLKTHEEGESINRKLKEEPTAFLPITGPIYSAGIIGNCSILAMIHTVHTYGWRPSTGLHYPKNAIQSIAVHPLFPIVMVATNLYIDIVEINVSLEDDVHDDNRYTIVRTISNERRKYCEEHYFTDNGERYIVTDGTRTTKVFETKGNDTTLWNFEEPMYKLDRTERRFKMSPSTSLYYQTLFSNEGEVRDFTNKDVVVKVGKGNYNQIFYDPIHANRLVFKSPGWQTNYIDFTEIAALSKTVTPKEIQQTQYKSRDNNCIQRSQDYRFYVDVVFGHTLSLRIMKDGEEESVVEMMCVQTPEETYSFNTIQNVTISENQQSAVVIATVKNFRQRVMFTLDLTDVKHIVHEAEAISDDVDPLLHNRTRWVEKRIGTSVVLLLPDNNLLHESSEVRSIGRKLNYFVTGSRNGIHLSLPAKAPVLPTNPSLRMHSDMETKAYNPETPIEVVRRVAKYKVFHFQQDAPEEIHLWRTA